MLPQNFFGALSIQVLGNLRGLYEAWKQHGKLPQERGFGTSNKPSITYPMIGTIVVASGGFGTQKQNRENNNNNNQQPGRLLRSPSLLQRVKSINLYRYKSEELNPFSSITITTLQPSELEHSQQVLDTFNIPHDDKQHIDQFPYENLDENLEENHHLPMDETYHNIEDHHSFRDDEEVDAKADDFINKFKNQLKLQRLDSILRYKEMLGRGADK
ncbi:hypothetical protein IFM89_003712 [Coptis chinensis]|uniref:Uncharacterized protein n=1 Tax=Coptis chinensis TaxID=261450 RepID=A0A835LTT4_9MAGN|nr:hypothetical protein IFM89_003712 [Coptis chinensis]